MMVYKCGKVFTPWYTMVCRGKPWYYHGSALVYHGRRTEMTIINMILPWHIVLEPLLYHGSTILPYHYITMILPWYNHSIQWYTMVLPWYTMVNHDSTVV